MPTTKHIVFSAVPAWGHARPFCILAARLVKESEDIVVTMLLAPNHLEKADREVLAELQGEAEALGQRIRILSTIDSQSSIMFDLLDPLAQTYETVYETLVQEKSIVCAMRGTIFDPVPAPKLVVLDFFAYPQYRATRTITGHTIPVIAWISGHASGIIRLFGPESLGGMGDLGEKIDIEASRLGMTPDEIFNHTDGTLVEISGLPPMYDYEFFPQQLPFDVQVNSLLRDCHKLLRDSDGCISTSLYAYEEDSLNSMKSWLSGQKKSFFAIGPLLPSDLGTTRNNYTGVGEVGEFLDKMLLERGEKSVLLMSFGTGFFPTAPEYLEEVIEGLIDKNIPFIFCFASPFANLSAGLVEKVASSGLGILVKWAPQQFVLSHPATGWFLSHGGQNSVLESLACGVPLIIWPFQADQPEAAAHLSENLCVAIELIEVRTGEHAVKPMYRNGRAAKGTREAVGLEIRQVLDECQGLKGKHLRENAEEMKRKFAEAWNAKGSSRNELQALLHEYL